MILKSQQNRNELVTRPGVVQDGTLRTATNKYNHKVVPDYHLQVRVFDNGTPPLFSDAFVTVHIIEESRYPPLVAPLEVTVNSFLDDFPGAVIGTVVATDQDPYDQLSYDLVPGSHSFSAGNLIGSPESGAPFEIDGRKGTVVALQVRTLALLVEQILDLPGSQIDDPSSQGGYWCL